MTCDCMARKTVALKLPKRVQFLKFLIRSSLSLADSDCTQLYSDSPLVNVDQANIPANLVWIIISYYKERQKIFSL